MAKMTNYMGGGLTCDILFGLFMAAWLVTRHILFTLVLVSIYVDVPKYCPFKWDPANGYYVTNNVYIGFLVMMCLLQVSQVPYSRHIEISRTSLR
jgi:acyl-CoA-dependent ceramide synthase